jgi:hypothetical protein
MSNFSNIKYKTVTCIILLLLKYELYFKFGVISYHYHVLTSKSSNNTKQLKISSFGAKLYTAHLLQSQYCD